jgi:hypothetical protein
VATRDEDRAAVALADVGQLEDDADHAGMDRA